MWRALTLAVALLLASLAFAGDEANLPASNPKSTSPLFPDGPALLDSANNHTWDCREFISSRDVLVWPLVGTNVNSDISWDADCASGATTVAEVRDCLLELSDVVGTPALTSSTYGDYLVTTIGATAAAYGINAQMAGGVLSMIQIVNNTGFQLSDGLGGSGGWMRTQDNAVIAFRARFRVQTASMSTDLNTGVFVGLSNLEENNALLTTAGILDTDTDFVGYFIDMADNDMTMDAVSDRASGTTRTGEGTAVLTLTENGTNDQTNYVDVGAILRVNDVSDDADNGTTEFWQFSGGTWTLLATHTNVIPCCSGGTTELGFAWAQVRSTAATELHLDRWCEFYNVGGVRTDMLE